MSDSAAPAATRARCRVLFPLLLLAAWLGLALPARALDAGLSLSQYHHSRWTARDGAPLGIRRMAQTNDGWLWLGSSSGLYRFDGVHFERFSPAADPEFGTRRVATLLATPQGDLWVGLADGGGISRIDAQGRMSHYPEAAGAGPATVRSFEVDADGVVWALSATGLQRFDGQAWQPVGADWQLHMSGSGGFFIDARGWLWIWADETLSYLPRGARAFVATSLRPDADSRSMSNLDGQGWLFSEQHIRRLVAGDGAEDAVPAVDPVRLRRASSSMLIDRDRNLWTVFCPAGLCRRRLPEALDPRGQAMPAVIEQFGARDGLSSDVGMTILEDREGSLWVATQTGLDRFRNSKLVRADLPGAGTNFILSPQPGGAMLVGANEPRRASLWQLDPAGRALRELALPKGIERIVALHRDAAGRQWLGESGGVWRIDEAAAAHKGQALTRVSPPPSPGAFAVRALSEDERGLLALTQKEGLQREPAHGGTGWAAWAGGDPTRDPPSASIMSLARDSSGGSSTLWLGYRGDRLLQLAPGERRAYGAEDGIAVGTVTLIYAGRQLLIAGQGGVQFLLGQRFYSLRPRDADEFRGVTGIVEARNGDLWFNGLKGAVRLERAEFERVRQRALQPPGQAEEPLRTTLFDSLDGYPSSAMAFTLQPSAVRGDDGRLWFSGIDGVAWIRPEGIRRNELPPPVQLQGLLADGRPHALDAGATGTLLPSPLRLPEGTRHVEIHYTALSLAMPERVRFRVRLEGVDADWHDAGTRREIAYSNLVPGRYRFQVLAANEDGVWNEQGATLSFLIPPRWVQTAGFKAGTALLLGGLLWGAYSLRLRRLRRQLAGKQRERLAERERIARELHDTLLQGLHGLVLGFQRVANRMVPSDPARALMEQELQRADRLIVEGRDRVLELRAPDQLHEGLAVALGELGAALASDHGIEFSLDGDGQQRTLKPAVRGEVYLIGREALRNAFRHARACRVRVELRDSWRGLLLRVEDDGIGIEPVLLRQGRPGHWGLLGMRERAALLGGRLRIVAGALGGTVVELRLSGRRAYGHGRAGSSTMRHDEPSDE